jgi:hypothetical protein
MNATKTPIVIFKIKDLQDGRVLYISITTLYLKSGLPTGLQFDFFNANKNNSTFEDFENMESISQLVMTDLPNQDKNMFVEKLVYENYSTEQEQDEFITIVLNDGTDLSFKLINDSDLDILGTEDMQKLIKFRIADTPNEEKGEKEVAVDKSTTPDSEVPDSEVPDSEVPDSEVPDSETKTESEPVEPEVVK